MNLLDLARAALPDPATAAPVVASPDQARELRELVGIVAADWPADEQAEALAVALADPDSALTCFQALAVERQDAHPAPMADAGMRTCRQSANLAPSGRCLAAWRGERFGVDVATLTRNYTPSTPDVSQRCGPFLPKPEDTDQRPGRERWPFLFELPGPH